MICFFGHHVFARPYLSAAEALDLVGSYRHNGGKLDDLFESRRRL
jgi:hypothetical protein